jgi:hypothetical protein
MLFFCRKVFLFRYFFVVSFLTKEKEVFMLSTEYSWTPKVNLV